MPRLRQQVWLVLALAAASGFVSGCRRAIVIVPERREGYTARDTLYGTRNGNRVTVFFRHDTTWRVDTVTKLDTLWRGGTRTLVRVDTLVRRDTVRIPGLLPGRQLRDTIVITRRDSIIVTRRDTVVRRDTVLVSTTGGVVRVDTVLVPTPGGGRVDTVVVVQRDTLIRSDTVQIVVRDTVFRSDTIRVVERETMPGPVRRMLFVPPGHYPPAGQCRVWIHNLPPGRQARAAPCDALGTIPDGAFILFGDEAWDYDFDWTAEAAGSNVPAQIVAISRRRGRSGR